jgi:hypothetical protein
MRDYADKAIRKELLNPDNLRDVIQARVPELASGFDFTRVTHVPTHFLLPDARSREGDLLFEIPYRVGDTRQCCPSYFTRGRARGEPLEPSRNSWESPRLFMISPRSGSRCSGI